VQQVPPADNEGLPPIGVDLNALVAAARINPPEVKQRRPRYGRPGVCVACKEAVQAHFDGAGGWIGCPAASPNAVFVLVPVGGDPLVPPTRQRRSTANRVRRFRAARYFPATTRVDLDALSDHRKRTMKAVLDAGDSGAVVGTVRRQSGLSTGSVSQALAWLEAHKLIHAREDDSSGS
jgi:hypothetical protein